MRNLRNEVRRIVREEFSNTINEDVRVDAEQFVDALSDAVDKIRYRGSVIGGYWSLDFNEYRFKGKRLVTNVTFHGGVAFMGHVITITVLNPQNIGTGKLNVAFEYNKSATIRYIVNIPSGRAERQAEFVARELISLYRRIDDVMDSEY